MIKITDTIKQKIYTLDEVAFMAMYTFPEREYLRANEGKVIKDTKYPNLTGLKYSKEK